MSPAARWATFAISPRSSRIGSSRPEILLEHVRVAEDDGQDVVEVEGDAAGEPAHRFHLLRLAELASALWRSAMLGAFLVL